jgi:asparagine synthase (glutamine-hydrolysing)
VLVYNGEVYNYRDLRAELEKEGAVFEGSGDSEVVLHALRCWGPETAIPRLDGMFALAYLDRARETLWLARDRLGIKPLYVSERGARIAVASEIKGLLAHPDVDARPDMQALAILMAQGRLSGKWTPFRGISPIEPGTYWKLTRQGVETRRYFHVLENLDAQRLVRASRDGARGAVEAFESAFAESVRLHLASDVPLAAMCSGGVDSSLVAAHAKRHHPELHAYVVDVGGAQGEAARAEQVGRGLGIPIRRVRLERPEYARLLPIAAWFHEHPLVFPSSPALLAVARRCRADGVRVLLTGEGADELFGGYPWQARAYRRSRKARRRWRRGARQNARVQTRLSGASRRGDPAGLGLATALDSDSEQRAHAIFERLEGVEPVEDRVFLTRCLDDCYWHLGPILQHHDRMGMAASIEMRVPFLENALIDLALHLPRRAKLHRRQSKWVVKKAAEKRLPRDVVYAPKRGFWMPPAFHLLADGLLRGGAVAELFRWSSRSTQNLLERVAQNTTLRFQLTSFELWARLFLRGESCDELADRLERPAV